MNVTRVYSHHGRLDNTLVVTEEEEDLRGGKEKRGREPELGVFEADCQLASDESSKAQVQFH